MRKLALPPSSCPHCLLSWHDCHSKRHDSADGDNCCPGCRHLPDVDRERDEIELGRMRDEARDELAEAMVAMYDGALTLDYTLAQAREFMADDTRLYIARLRFYVDRRKALVDAAERIVKLTDPYFQRMPGAVMRDVLAVMPAKQRAEVTHLQTIAYPSGSIPLPHERNTKGGAW